jgi:DegV family protein with EDD domain
MGYLEGTFVITTESNSEIPFQWEDETGVQVLQMPYSVNGKEFYYDLGRETDIGGFYKTMRAGAEVSTALRNPNEIVEYFEPHLKAGRDILHIGFSSALSGTFHNATIAASELMEKYPERRIHLVDSLSISAPLAHLVEDATRMQKEGKSMDEIAEWVENHKLKICALFTVEDLVYLRRGGRLSGAAAFFGSVLELKPVLYISPEGKLVPIDKVRGRKKALRYLLNKCEETIENPGEQCITIMQADCHEEAEAFAALVQETIHPKSVRIHPVGPVLGTHAGPGTMAVCYYSKGREFIRA